MVGRKLEPVLMGLVSALSPGLSLGLQDSLFSRRLVEKPEGKSQAVQASNSEEERPSSHAYSRAFLAALRRSTNSLSELLVLQIITVWNG